MPDVLSLAAANLLSPMVLFFALGLAAALARSDLAVPEAVAKTLALYLMLAIGFKGGAGMAKHGLDGAVVATLVAGIVLSFVIPVIAFRYLAAVTGLPRVDRAAVAAHYGSISIVTLGAGMQALSSVQLPFEGFLVAVAAAMETPAIVTALLLAHGVGAKGENGGAGPKLDAKLWREVGLNGSIVMLVGSFVIGWITGEKGLAAISPFIIAPYQGILCLFLLDMGLVAGRGLIGGGKVLSPGLVVFAVTMPVISAVVAALVCLVLPLSPGGAAILITLAASASYIAVPAAMRVALPEARPSVYLTASLCLTFPFNLTIGIPLYIALGGWVAG